MLFVLFIMVGILLVSSFLNVKHEKSITVNNNKPQYLKKTVSSTSKPITTTSKPITTTSTAPIIEANFYEETAKPVIDWNKVGDFFFGPEETTEATEKSAKSQSTTRKPPLSETNNSLTNQFQPTKKEVSTSIPSQLQKKPTGNLFIATSTQSITHDLPRSNTPSTFLQQSFPDTEFNSTSKKDLYTHPIEQSFDEWPKSEGTTPLQKKNPNEEVESIQISQNLTFGNRTANFIVQKDCGSTRCGLAASKIISSIDLFVEPCSDFYRFACGGSLSKVQMEPELVYEEPTTASVFYKSCLKHESHFNYRERIRRTKKVLSGIKIFKFYEEEEEADLTDVIGSLVLLDAMPLFNIDIDVSNSKFILKMLPPDQRFKSKYWSPLTETRKNCLRSVQADVTSSPLDITLLYYDYEECQRTSNDYFKSLETAMGDLGNFGNSTNEQIEKCIDETVDFLRKDLLPILNEMHSVSDLQEKIVNLQYVNMNIKDIQKQFPFFDWYKLLENISVKQIKSSTTIQVYDKTYFDILFRKLSLFDMKKLINGFIAMLSEKYYQELVLPTPIHSRPKYCSKMTQELFPDISNYLIRKVRVNEDFADKENYILDLFQTMKHDYQNILNNLKWLDDLSRNSMLNKLKNLKLATYQINTENESMCLHKHYSRLNLKEDDYSFNYNTATQFRRNTVFSLVDESITSEKIFRNFMDNQKTEPLVFYDHHVAYIPDGLIDNTFVDLPKYLILARIGFPLAKIIGHVFDPIGIKFGLKLSDNVSSLYNKFVQESRRILPHHFNFNQLELVFGLNSGVSNVERVAENAAMALLTDSIDEMQHQPLLPWVSLKYSREKIFFIALVQEFCSDITLMEFVVQAHENPILPTQFLVQNILQNSDEFKAQFSCPTTTKLPQLQFPYLSVLTSKFNDKIT